MEDWLHWTETWSVYILRPHKGRHILPRLVREMWKHLRGGILYYLRVHPTPEVPATATKATRWLKKYAKAAEKHIGKWMCKYNFHVLICRLIVQESQRGKVATGTEYWVENLVQSAKTIIRGRTTSHPEKVLVNYLCLERALTRFRYKYPEVAGLEQWGSERHRGEIHRSNTDTGAPDGTQLLGSGTVVPAHMLGTCKRALTKVLEDFPGLCQGWNAESVTSATFLKYAYADRAGNEVVHSQSYKPPKSRVSYNVLVQYVENGVHVSYVAVIQFFVKVMAPACEPLRLAISNLHRVEFLPEEIAIGSMWAAKDMGKPTHENYPVLFAHMLDKHVMAAVGKAAWFMPYSNMSGT
eukprot:jgi/Botrbrau1/19716/Bobra.0003s0076.1